MRRRHLAFYRSLAGEAAGQLDGAEQRRWLARLDAEHDNLRAALDWSESGGERSEEGLLLAADLWRFWVIRGYLSEGRRRLGRLLASPPAAGPSELRARLLEAAAALAHNQGDTSAALTDLEEGLAIWRQLGDEQGIASALRDLGWIAWRRGEYGDARALSQQSLERHRALGDPRGEAQCLNNLGWVALMQGDFPHALAALRESLELRRRQGDRRRVAFCRLLEACVLLLQGRPEEAEQRTAHARADLRQLGDRQLTALAASLLALVAEEEGNFAKAKDLAGAQALPAFREIGDRWGIAFALTALGDAALGGGDLEEAAACFEEGLTLRRETGDRWGEAVSLARLADLRLAQGRPAAAAPAYRRSLELRRALGDRYGVTESLAGLAMLAAEGGDLDEAARLASAVETLLESLGAALRRRLRRGFERAAERVRAGLGEEALEEAQRLGRALASGDLPPGSLPAQEPIEPGFGDARRHRRDPGVE